MGDQRGLAAPAFCCAASDPRHETIAGHGVQSSSGFDIPVRWLPVRPPAPRQTPVYALHMRTRPSGSRSLLQSRGAGLRASGRLKVKIRSFPSSPRIRPLGGHLPNGSTFGQGDRPFSRQAPPFPAWGHVRRSARISARHGRHCRSTGRLPEGRTRTAPRWSVPGPLASRARRSACCAGGRGRDRVARLLPPRRSTALGADARTTGAVASIFRGEGAGRGSTADRPPSPNPRRRRPSRFADDAPTAWRRRCWPGR